MKKLILLSIVLFSLSSCLLTTDYVVDTRPRYQYPYDYHYTPYWHYNYNYHSNHYHNHNHHNHNPRGPVHHGPRRHR